MANKTTKNENFAPASMKLEEAMARLDEVVAALDSEQTDLERALALYEEGVGLVRVCRERLSEADRTVRMLRLNSDGEIVETEMSVREDKGE